MFNKLIGKRKAKSSSSKPDVNDGTSDDVVIIGGGRGGAGGVIPLARFSESVSFRPNNGQFSSFFETLPSFRDIGNSEKPSLLLKKLNLCSYVFDFSIPLKNAKEKEIKRQTLVEIVDYVGAVGKLSEQAMEESCKMIAANLFRALPPLPHEDGSPSQMDSLDPDEDEAFSDPAWPHLQLVYEFLLRIIVSPDMNAKLAKKHMDHSFVLHLLDLFESEDPRERECLKTLIHRIYGKFMVHRPFIRKALDNIFYRFIFETEKHNGICELLEIVGSIVIGFALPLKEEHKLFLVRSLIPLHKPKSMAVYHQQLSYCVIQFVEKDFKLADIVIRGLLKYWPVTNSQKEVLFLGELEEVLEATQSTEFQKCMVPLFQQIGQCLSSCHFQVAERALFFWNNDHIINLIAQNRHVLLPILFKHFEANIKTHWNQAVQSLTLNIRMIFLDIDPDLFHDCQRRHQQEVAQARVAEEKRERTWKHLESLISKEDIILNPNPP